MKFVMLQSFLHIIFKQLTIVLFDRKLKKVRPETFHVAISFPRSQLPYIQIQLKFNKKGR